MVTPRQAVGSAAISEVSDAPLRVEWTVDDGEGQATAVPVDGLAEWATPWSQLARVHQLDLTPATSIAYTARVTPLIRVGSTAFGAH